MIIAGTRGRSQLRSLSSFFTERKKDICGNILLKPGKATVTVKCGKDLTDESQADINSWVTELNRPAS